MSRVANELHSLTTAEVAFAASAPLRFVNHLIEDDLLPADLYHKEGSRRRFLPPAVFMIAFHHSTFDMLTASVRRNLGTVLLSKYLHHELGRCWDIGHYLDAYRDECKKHHITASWGVVKIDATPIFKTTCRTMTTLLEARDCVVRDPKILSGTPVIRGTRIPVYDVAANVAKNVPIERILAAYPDLTRRQVDLAGLWTEANPPTGRPPIKMSPVNRADVSQKRVGRRVVG